MSAVTTAPPPPKQSPTVGTLFGHVALAGIANSCGQTVGHPFDLLKLRLQVQGKDKRQSAADRHYRGVVHGLRTIVAEDGPRGLFSAWRVSVARELTYSGMRVGLYEPCRDVVQRWSGDPNAAHGHASLVAKIAAGAMSGALASTLCNPMDILKVRYQAVSGAAYAALPSPSQALAAIARTDGVRGLWRGCSPNVLRATLITSVQMSAYDHTKHALLRGGWLGGEGQPAHIAASVVASFLCIVVTNPVDVVKTRMMAVGGSEYGSLFGCARRVVVTEGPQALYKGALLAYLRLGPHTTVTFVVLEQLRRMCGIRPI